MRPSLAVATAVALLAAAPACTNDSDEASTAPRSVPASSTPPATSIDSSPVTTAPDQPPTSAEYDRSIPEGDEPEVFGPLGETEAEFDTETGVVQIGVAEVPASVAAALPLPDDLTVQIASQDGDASGFSGVSQLSFDELIDFYEVSLPEAGYEVERSQFVADVVAVFDFTGPDGTGQVAISSAPGGGRTVLVTFAS